MYIKKQKELKTFLPTFIYLFADLTSEYCRSASYSVAPPQSCQNCEGILFCPVITILWLRLWSQALWSQALWSQSAECNSSFYVQSRRHPIITVIIGFPSIRGGRCHKKVSKISSMTYIWFHGAYCHLTDVTMCYQVTKWHFFSQSCDNLDMTRDFHPSLAKLSPQSLLKHPWTIKKRKGPQYLRKALFLPLFFFFADERGCVVAIGLVLLEPVWPFLGATSLDSFDIK